MAKEITATTNDVRVTKRVITAPPAPQQVRIYYKDGTSQDVFPVDAKEAIAGGEYTLEPPVSPELVAEKSAAVGDDFDAMTKAELQEYADTHGIQLEDHMLKADMVEAIRAGGVTNA